MSTEAALLNAIRLFPDDDTARLVYADYLDEQGGAASAARAEFVRTQVTLAGLNETAPERPALEDRENELLRQYERKWIGPLPAPLAAGLTAWRFERGFLGKIRTDTKTLCNHGNALFAAHPISRVRLVPPDPDDAGPVARLAKREWWPRVRDLGLRDFSDPSEYPCEPLLLSPQLTRLRRLDFSPNEEDDAGPLPPDMLTRAPWLGGLEELRITDWPHDGTGLVPVLNASAVRRLRLFGCAFTIKGLAALLSRGSADRPCRIELEDGNLGAELWPALTGKKVKPVLGRLSFTGIGRNADLDLPTLLSTPATANLNALDAGETNLSGVKVRVLATSGFMGRATEIGLTRCHVNATTMTALAKVDAPHLRALVLGETGLRTKGVRAMCEALWADGLTRLDLMRNHLDDDALIAMARSGRFVNLRHLDLRVNSTDLAPSCKCSVGDAGVTALAAAPNFARLRHLNLYRTRVSAAGVEALLNSPHWRLSELELGGYELGADLVRVLARSPRLARLSKLGLSFTPSLGGDALLPLAESPHLSPLCHLDVRYNNTSDRVRAQFAKRLGRRLDTDPSVSPW